MAEAKKPEDKHIVDVARPGKSSPSDTSKPIIVNNRPILQDPMVSGKSVPATKDAKSTKMPSREITIQPLGAPEQKDEAKAEPEAKDDQKKPDDSKTIAQLAEEATGPQAPEATENKELKIEEPGAPAEDKADKPEEPAPGDEPADEEPAAPSDNSNDKGDEKDSKEDGEDQQTPGEKDARAEAEQAKKDEALQKIVDSKKYFLPINTVEKRKSKRFVAFGIFLSLLLIVAWVNIALDAGLIEINGIKPVTHFFST